MFSHDSLVLRVFWSLIGFVLFVCLFVSKSFVIEHLHDSVTGGSDSPEVAVIVVDCNVSCFVYRFFPAQLCNDFKISFLFSFFLNLNL